MTNLFESVHSEDVFNLKPNLSEVGFRFEYYLTYYSSKLSFIDLIDPKVTKNDLPEGPLKSWF